MIAYAIIWQNVLKSIDLSLANAITSIVPLIVFISGILLFNEPVKLLTFIGFGFVLTGITLIAFSKRTKSP